MVTTPLPATRVSLPANAGRSVESSTAAVATRPPLLYPAAPSRTSPRRHSHTTLGANESSSTVQSAPGARPPC
jgi:hypothetical protein